MEIFLSIFNRIKEPSTMAGLAVLLGLFGVPVEIAAVAPELVTQIIAGGVALFAVVMPESNKGPVPSDNIKQPIVRHHSKV